MGRELTTICRNVDHIKEIVSAQQNYASNIGVLEPVTLADLIEDALRINNAALIRHDVQLRREYASSPQIVTDRHKVLQVLVNLINNAKYAMDNCLPRVLSLRIETDANAVRISVTDTGEGIAPENLTRIFSHGFTTSTGAPAGRAKSRSRSPASTNLPPSPMMASASGSTTDW